MTITSGTGRTRNRRRAAVGLLLACSTLASPAFAQTTSPIPSPNGPLPSLPDSTSPAPAADLRGSTALPQETDAAAANDGQDTNDPNAGSVPDRRRDGPEEASYVEDLNQPYQEPLDPGAEPIDAREQPRELDDPTGLRLGSFLLRPSVNNSIETERTRSNGTTTRRDYLSTTIRGTLSSDWSRHSLTVTGEGVFERNIHGGGNDVEPEADIEADLRLDLADDTVTHITGGYRFSREDDYDPNAVGGASTQPGEHEFTGGLSVERDLGKIKGLAALDLYRAAYTDAKLSDGSTVSAKDRNRTGIDGRLRLGYELSPALVPFVELATGRTFYDQRRDGSGYARSSQSYAARTGVEFDFGEKLRGEIGAGYEIVDYEDSRLRSVDAVTFDGNAIWSPRRGTDVDLGLRTTVQDSTAPGEGGWVEYQLTAALSHEMRHNLVARLTGSTTLRDFSGSGDETVWVAGAGLTWAVNPYLDLTGDLEYERAKGGGADERIVRAGVGLTVRR